MKVFTATEVIKIMRKNNYVVVRQKGSHQIWVHGETKVSISLPTGKGSHDINRMLWQRIVKENHIICKF